MEVLIKQENKCKVPTIEEAFVTLEKRLRNVKNEIQYAILHYATNLLFF